MTIDDSLTNLKKFLNLYIYQYNQGEPNDESKF